MATGKKPVEETVRRGPVCRRIAADRGWPLVQAARAVEAGGMLTEDYLRDVDGLVGMLCRRYGLKKIAARSLLRDVVVSELTDRQFFATLRSLRLAGGMWFHHAVVTTLRGVAAAYLEEQSGEEVNR